VPKDKDMPLTAQLRNEHDLLLGMADEMAAVITPEPPHDLTPVFFLLARFNQLLHVHLAREDVIVYPPMIGGNDPHAAAVATAFLNELATIDEQVQRFESTWTGGEVSSCWTDFCQDLRELVTSIRRRIERENEELYPLLPEARKAA
jgi:iron-sulfur cluster repair protein YtfE (RIC family)